MTSYEAHVDLMGVITHLKTTFAEASSYRSERKDWIEFEREAMWKAVNEQRNTRGKDPVTLQDVERAECMAVGHIDYADKFAFYCAQLVFK